MSKAGFLHVAPSPEGQRLVSRKALSLGGSRERSGRGEKGSDVWMFGCLDVWIRPPTVDAMVTIACNKTATVHYLQGAASAAEKTQTKFR